MIDVSTFKFSLYIIHLHFTLRILHLSAKRLHAFSCIFYIFAVNWICRLMGWIYFLCLLQSEMNIMSINIRHIYLKLLVVKFTTLLNCEVQKKYVKHFCFNKNGSQQNKIKVFPNVKRKYNITPCNRIAKYYCNNKKTYIQTK